MKSLELKKYGTILTGRPFGVQAFAELKNNLNQEAVQLDFSGVISLGSSFGEEVIVPIAKNQNNEIKIKGAISPVKACVTLIAFDFNIKVDFI